MATLWTTYDGRMLTFAEMDDFHLVNVYHHIKERMKQRIESFKWVSQNDDGGDMTVIAYLQRNDAIKLFAEVRAEYRKRGFYYG